ncbi:hypothetical protein B0J17DRAFT_715451 [Rhizoctonia solani]|nr:hypothetical protein B0J17DRAFT_715451 [Rhizoctonia solani]
MSANIPSGATPTVSPFVFLPPTGGDLTLQSCDGTTFQVHSVLLGLASTVFAGMFTAATKSHTVELAEDAEAVSLMLAFIYPVSPPAITTASQLEKVMLLSQKYDVARMIDFVETYNYPDNQLILSDPIRVFRASAKHNFLKIQALSAKTFGLKHCNLYDLKGIEELAGLLPEWSSVVGLLGAQMIRGKLLSNLLKDSPVLIDLRPKGSSFPYNSHSHSMACRQCWDRSRQEPNSCYIPGWMHHWLSCLYDRLIDKPRDLCVDLLNVSYIVDIHGSSSSGCSACATQTLTKRTLFEQWARDTKKFVDKELEVLDKLYTL